MATFVKGNAVENAVGYELLEYVAGAYVPVPNAEIMSEINFEVSAMGFEEGDHYLAVKAKGDGVNYADSDPSDTVKYTVADVPIEIVNLYSAEDSPAGKWYVGNTWTVDSANTKVLLAKNTPIASSSALIVDNIPVESGKTYSFKLYNAPSEIAKSDGSMIPYYGIVALFFYETIDGKQSVRYAHSMTGTFTEHVSYWNTSKYPDYTGAIPISGTDAAEDTFGTSKENNASLIEITNLTSGKKNSTERFSVFKNSHSPAGQVKINSDGITHMAVVFGNPNDTNFISGGVPTADGFSTAIATIQNNLLFVEGDTLPESYGV